MVAMKKKKYQAMEGLKYIIKIVDKIEDEENKEIWIAYEVGKRTLTERLYQMKVTKVAG